MRAVPWSCRHFDIRWDSTADAHPLDTDGTFDDLCRISIAFGPACARGQQRPMALLKDLVSGFVDLFAIYTRKDRDLARASSFAPSERFSFSSPAGLSESRAVNRQQVEPTAWTMMKCHFVLT